MNRIAFKTVFSGIILLASLVTSRATTYTFSPTPANLNNLDHHLVYSWRVDNITLGTNVVITGATLTFSHIANWDNTANMLFVHLLDTAKYAGVHSFTDATGAPVSSSQIHDNFATPYLNTTNPSSPYYNPLIVSGTGNTPATGNTWLFSRPFTMTPTNYTFTFTAAELVILQSYIANGHNIAFGIDPDCHYFNNGITFSFTTASVPEAGSTGALMGMAVGLLLYARRKLRS
jgi:hypothetical protein